MESAEEVLVIVVLLFFRFKYNKIKFNFNNMYIRYGLHFSICIGISDVPHPPRFAYLISGSNHVDIMLRQTLIALYNPNNRYVVHLDAGSSPEEQLELHNFVKSHPVFLKLSNVVMITKANLVTRRGPTMVANTLHATTIMLREGSDWD